jgi:pimeloyl-ACP methyl ester carboxylesterase
MTDAPLQMIAVVGLTTAYALAEGSGVDSLPVLALHGWGGSIASFWPVAQQLQRCGYTTHVLALPGFGGTQLPPEPWGVPEYADFALAYLDAQGLARVHLLGHSFGGRICLILGAEHADRVGKIVLANCAGVRQPPNPAWNVLVRASKAVFSLPGLNRLYEPVRRRAYRYLGATDYLEAGPLQDTFVRVVEQDLLPYAARISRPTLLIWGDRDRDTPLRQGQQLEQTIPDAGLHVFQGAGHFSYLERLPDYVRIVNHFFSQDSDET